MNNGFKVEIPHEKPQPRKSLSLNKTPSSATTQNSVQPSKQKSDKKTSISSKSSDRKENDLKRKKLVPCVVNPNKSSVSECLFTIPSSSSQLESTDSLISSNSNHNSLSSSISETIIMNKKKKKRMKVIYSDDSDDFLEFDDELDDFTPPKKAKRPSKTKKSENSIQDNSADKLVNSISVKENGNDSLQSLDDAMNFDVVFAGVDSGKEDCITLGDSD